MGVTVLSLYHTFQQRAYSSAAPLILRQILDAQITYFRKHNKFFPEDGRQMQIVQGDSFSKEKIRQIREALNIDITVDHLLNFYIQTYPDSPDDFCTVVISANSIIFQNGAKQIIGTVNENGKMVIF